MILVFTDLDGSLLDHRTYDWAPARPAVERLKEHDIPWVLVTSKTRAEAEEWRKELGNEHPFIVENGGAIYLPHGYFSPVVQGGARLAGAYEVVEFGTPYNRLVRALKYAARISNCPVRAFSDMTIEEVAEACDLSLEWAARAKQREYDEAFEILMPEHTDALLEAIRSLEFTITQGGRFWHILGDNSKGHAVLALQRLFERKHGSVTTIGLGDGLNDSDFLKLMDRAVLIRSKFAGELKSLIPSGIVSEDAGPEGWNRVMLQLIENPLAPVAH